MPFLEKSTYRSRPFYMLNAHWETIIPSVFFKGPQVNFTRSRLELVDGDFLDLDCLKKGNDKCMVITHGLEGGSDRPYVRRAANYFSERGWDIIAWNCRSCSGEMNRLPRLYHHGDTGDLTSVVDLVLKEDYESIVLSGTSMGGSLSLKYLGEASRDDRIKGALTFSVPCNLKDSSNALRLAENRFYEQRFLKKLKVKLLQKADMFSDFLSAEVIEGLKTFDEFHEVYTAKYHGFSSMGEFFESASCDKYFEGINIPVFIGNALNDPMLVGGCYPVEVAQNHPNIYLEIPKVGGHAGFTLPGKTHSWMEERAEAFILQQVW